MHRRVAENLCQQGILKEEQKKVLWLFTSRRFPERDPKPEREIMARLDAAIFKNSRDVDPRTVVLLSVAQGTGLLPLVFEKKKLKERKKRIEQIVAGEACGKAAADAVQAAIMAAVVVPTLMTTMITTSR